MKSKILAGLFGVFAFVSLAFAAYSTFTDIKVNDDLWVVDDVTVNGKVTVDETLEVTQGVTFSTVTATGYLQGNFVVLSSTYSISATTPSVVGQLALDSNYDLYVASGTDNPTQWIKVGAQ